MGKRSRQKKRTSGDAGKRARGNGAAATPDQPGVEPAAPGEAAPAEAKSDDDRKPAADGASPAAAGDHASDDVAPLRAPGRDRDKPPIPEPDIGAAQLRILYELYRWIVLRAEVPEAEEWRQLVGYPHPAEVDEAFGGWNEMLHAAALDQAETILRLREAEAVVEQAERQRRVLTQRAERHESQLADLQRRLDAAREKVDAERDARRDAELRAEAAERRAREATAALERAQAAADRKGDEEGADPGAVELLRSQLEEADAARANLEETAEVAFTQLDEALSALEERDRRITELSRALAIQEGTAEETEAGEDGGESPPASVLEAVMRARDRFTNLTFADSAFTSAASSPFGRPQLVYEALERLDGLAARYRQGAMGAKLGDVAREMGLQWRGGVSETARTRHARHYRFVYQGRMYPLGPHVNLGTGAGAGRIARIYLHLHEGDDDLERTVIVGHVGRHLPDTTT